MPQENENLKFSKVIESSIKKLKELIDIEIIVGNQIVFSDGSIVIPISKVSFFSLSGGGEYGKVNIFKKNEDLPYSAGNGAIVSVKPYGFLIKNKSGRINYVSAEQTSYEKIINRASDFIKEINEN